MILFLALWYVRLLYSPFLTVAFTSSSSSGTADVGKVLQAAGVPSSKPYGVVGKLDNTV